MQILSIALMAALLGGSVARCESAPAFALSQLTPAIYNDVEMKSFLANYLKLTASQMVQSDFAFAEARAKLFPLEESIKSAHAKLETSLAGGVPVTQWKPLVTRISQAQARMLEVEFTALQKFHQLLDGEQRYRLTQIPSLVKAAAAQAQPPVMPVVEQ
jgi:hypothetical protein